jgi:hypothetical protein
MFYSNIPMCLYLSIPGSNPNKSPLSILNISGFIQFYFWTNLTLSKEIVYADIAVNIEGCLSQRITFIPLL